MLFWCFWSKVEIVCDDVTCAEKRSEALCAHTHCFKVTEQEGNVTTGNSLTITPSDPVCVSECVCVCVCVGFLPWGRMHIIHCTIPHIMSSGCIALYVVSHTHTN